MGGRGASSGISDKGKKYGTEYTTYAQIGNIKFVKKSDGQPTSPIETMTSGRIYVTLDNNMQPKYISYYDKKNKRNKLVEIDGRPHKNLGSQHTHLGYYHDEYGEARSVNKEEKSLIDKVCKVWKNRKK